VPTDHLIFLTGTIPESLAKLGKLEVLDLSGNHLSGHFFILFAGRSPLTNLYFVQFHAGAIPESLGNLVKLQHLHLQENQLSGQFFFFFGVVSAD
jgi:Leucine-rich repeat (LRR) protein